MPSSRRQIRRSGRLREGRLRESCRQDPVIAAAREVLCPPEGVGGGGRGRRLRSWRRVARSAPPIQHANATIPAGGNADKLQRRE